MKAILLSLVLLVPVSGFSTEEEGRGAQAYRVVFEVTVEGVEKWEGVLRNVENLRKSLGKATSVEVVAHGKGIGLLLGKTAAEHPEFKAKLDKLHSEGVVFAGCENTMERMKLEKKDLVPSAVTVDSGVAEVVKKQTAGWAYVKSGG